MPDNSHDIVQKIARNVPLNDDEKEAVVKVTDRLLTDEDRRELAQNIDEHRLEVESHRQRMSKIRKKMAVTTARAKERKEKKWLSKNPDYTFCGLPKGFLN